MNTIRGLFGCEPDKFSTNKLNINAGVIWDFYGYNSYEFPAETQIDLTTIGVWGYDQSGGPVNGELCVYLIANATTGVYGFMASASIYEGGVNLPSGYAVKRKLPWGVMYNASRDGIPNFHLTHWPMPFIRLTDAESSSAYAALSAGNATAWTDIDLSSWVPDNARLAHILIELRYTSSACSAYLRSHTGQTTGMLIGSATPSSAYQVASHTIRVQSDRKMQYKLNAAGAQLYVYVLGYTMTEPA